MNAKVSRALQRRFATKIRRERVVVPRGGLHMPVGEYVDLFNQLNHLKG